MLVLVAQAVEGSEEPEQWCCYLTADQLGERKSLWVSAPKCGVHKVQSARIAVSSQTRVYLGLYSVKMSNFAGSPGSQNLWGWLREFTCWCEPLHRRRMGPASLPHCWG